MYQASSSASMPPSGATNRNGRLRTWGAGLRRVEQENGLCGGPAHTWLGFPDFEVGEFEDEVGHGHGFAHLGRLEVVGQLLAERREERRQGLLDATGADRDLDPHRLLVEPEPQRRRLDAGQEDRDDLVAVLRPARFITLRASCTSVRTQPEFTVLGLRTTRTCRACLMPSSIFFDSLSPPVRTRESAQTGRLARSSTSRSRFTTASSAEAWEMKI